MQALPPPPRNHSIGEAHPDRTEADPLGGGAALLELIRAARLPEPEANAKVGRHEVDLLWRAQRLIVEVDGYAFHSSRSAFERDRRRDAELLGAGYRVLRVSWRQIADEPMAVITTLARAIVA